MSNSLFYTKANRSLIDEIMRLENFCKELDADREMKQKNIAEYKCCKYRYAGITLIQVKLHNCNRIKDRLKSCHYILPAFDEILKKHNDYIKLYDDAPDSEKQDYGLYYGLTAVADEIIADINAKIQFADEWEKIELNERLGGLIFAKKSLDEAWEKRKDVE